MRDQSNEDFMVIHFFEEVALNGDQSTYRSIIFRKPLLFTILLINLTVFPTAQYCHVDFLFKLSEKMVDKRGFLNMINL